mgnify:CR=1 FL=1
MDWVSYDCRELLLGLSTNVNRPSVSLDLSCNDMRSEGGLILGGCIAELQNVHGIDLSDNGTTRCRAALAFT